MAGFGLAMRAAAERAFITAQFVGGLGLRLGNSLAVALVVDGDKDQVGAGDVRNAPGARA